MVSVRDPATGTFLYHCPTCGTIVHIKSRSGLRLVRAAGKCQGCRAFDTYNRTPEIIGIFEQWFGRVGLPESWRVVKKAA